MSDLPATRTTAALDDVPEELTGLLWREGEALVIVEDLQPRFRFAAPLVGVGLWVGFAGLIWAGCLLLAAGLAFVQGVGIEVLVGLTPWVWFGGALLALVLAASGLILGRPRRVLRITGDDAADTLVLQGEPGRDLHLVFDHGRTLVFPQVRQRRLTVHAIRWIARQVALHVGATLEDHLDDARWQQWSHDPEVRGQAYFHRERHENQARFAKRLRIEPAQPRDVVFEVGGLTWRQVEVEDGWLRCGGRAFPLRSIRDGYVRSVLHTIELRLLTDEGPVTVAPDVYSAQVFSHYRWLVGVLLEESRKLRALDRGSEDDVPDALTAAVEERSGPGPR